MVTKDFLLGDFRLKFGRSTPLDNKVEGAVDSNIMDIFYLRKKSCVEEFLLATLNYLALDKFDRHKLEGWIHLLVLVLGILRHFIISEDLFPCFEIRCKLSIVFDDPFSLFIQPWAFQCDPNVGINFPSFIEIDAS